MKRQDWLFLLPLICLGLTGLFLQAKPNTPVGTYTDGEGNIVILKADNTCVVCVEGDSIQCSYTLEYTKDGFSAYIRSPRRPLGLVCYREGNVFSKHRTLLITNPGMVGLGQAWELTKQDNVSAKP